MANPTRNRATRRWALALNLIAPGAGLVVLRREWLGLSVALLFASFGQLALWGLLLVPADLPRRVAVVAAVAASLVWLGAQWLGVVRAAQILSPEAEHNLGMLRERAAEAMAAGRYADAHDLLKVGRAINDEDLEICAQWARLLTLTGRFAEARKAWTHLLRVDHAGVYRREAINAVEQLPAAD